jgi:hypothetical protein
MPRRKGLYLIAVLSVAVSSIAWAGFFMQGARKAKGDLESQIIRKYTVEPCVLIADDTKLGAPEVEYWLIKDGEGIALFERDKAGEGSIIENHWSAKDGDHFFVYVRTSHGWEYILPEDRGQDAVRLVYLKGSYEKNEGEDGVTRPGGKPAAKCVLKPVSK